MKNAIIIIFMLLLSACASTYWVEKSFDPKGGTIGYRSDAPNAKSLDKDSQRQMAEFCAPGSPEIKSERYPEAKGMMYVSATMMAPVSAPHRHISFICSDRQPASK